jgi:hypothetical protein
VSRAAGDQQGAGPDQGTGRWFREPGSPLACAASCWSADAAHAVGYERVGSAFDLVRAMRPQIVQMGLASAAERVYSTL